MGRTTKNQLGPCLQKFVFFIVCLGVFWFFYQMAKYQKNAQLHKNSVVLGAETFAELFFCNFTKTLLIPSFKAI